MNNQNIILDIEKYLYKLRSKENNIDEYYSKELRSLTDKSKVIYLISICKLFETDEQRNKSRRIKDLIEQMKRYEQETKKSAIWHNKITGSFLFYKLTKENSQEKNKSKKL